MERQRDFDSDDRSPWGIHHFFSLQRGHPPARSIGWHRESSFIFSRNADMRTLGRLPWISVGIVHMIAILFFILNSGAWAQTSLSGDHVRIQLLPPSQAGEPLGIHYQIDPEWHIYWKNPGDSGAAPKFTSEDAEIRKILWPYPERLPIKDLTNYGYSHETVLFLDLKPLKPQATIHLEWLVCKIECIPGFGSLTYKTEDRPAAENPLYKKYLERVPQPAPMEVAKFISEDDSQFIFELHEDASHRSEIHVFPENGLKFQTQTPQVETREDSLVISVPRTSNPVPSTNSEGFTIVLKGGETRYFEVQVSTTKPQNLQDFLFGLLAAFLGGLILNAMPCVFPVLSLKVFSFLKEPEAQKIRKSSWHYTYGVLASFALIGLSLTLLRLIGESVGWGYQLQSPWLVYLLVVLFFVMALNFLGSFEMGNSFALWAGGKSSRSWLSGSFGTGVLAVVVASPCTAPFMGSALGLTLLLPWYQSLMIFLSLGLGMSFPMLLLGHYPGFSRWLPKPGAWMENLKQFMAFPMLVTALWLLWVLGNQKGQEALYLALGSLLLLSFFLWLGQKSRKLLMKLSCVFIFLGILTGAAFKIQQLSMPNGDSKESVSAWSPFDPALIGSQRKLQNVFVDFTASWCITCQINKKGVLDTEEIQGLFKETDTFLIRADWTNHDPAITKALAQFNRNSVPLYVFYPKGESNPQMLPQLLTKEMIRDLFK